MSKRVGYGQRRVKVTPEVFEMLFARGERLDCGIPDNARFLRLWQDHEGAAYWFVFESSEWDELEEGQVIPQIDPTGELVDHE